MIGDQDVFTFALVGLVQRIILVRQTTLVNRLTGAHIIVAILRIYSQERRLFCPAHRISCRRDGAKPKACS